MSETVRNSELLSCRQMARLFTDYLDDGMPRVERLRFEEHLSLCNGCTDYLDQLRDVITVSDRIEPEEIPEDLRDRFLTTFDLWRGDRDE